jgi:hypothetical protein
MFHEGDRIIPLARFGDMSHGQLEVAVVLLFACRQVACAVSVMTEAYAREQISALALVPPASRYYLRVMVRARLVEVYKPQGKDPKSSYLP